MYGLIGKMKVVPGKRDELSAILFEGVSGMPGCLSYVVAQDPTDPDAVWITEVWDSEESHKASLSLPSVKQAISRGKPLIAGFGERFETRPVGGQGLELAQPHVQRGFGSVRPYLHGPDDLPTFLERTFEAVILETNEGGPTLLQVGDSLLWVEAGDLPPEIEPWVGSVYVYVDDVDAVYARALELGARSIAAPEDKPYHERQAGFVDAGGNTWWVSTYMGAT